MVRRIAAALAAVALTATPVLAATPAPACVTAGEAESLALVALPEILRQTGSTCGARLPAASLLRQPGGAFLQRYDAEADRAWPAASAAMVKLSDPTMQVLLASQYARPLVTQMVATLLVGRIAPADCRMIDHVVTLLQPLPPRNTAGVVVTMLQYLKAEEAKGATIAVPDLPLCPAGGAR